MKVHPERGSVPTRIYADPGTDAVFEVYRPDGTSGEVDFSFSGYLSDV